MKIIELVEENNDLKTRTKGTGIDQKVSEYESRVIILSEEIGRLNSAIERKNIELARITDEFN